MKKHVNKYIEMQNGKVFRTALHGDVVPKGSVWVISDGEQEIRIPYGSKMHVQKADVAVNELLSSN